MVILVADKITPEQIKLAGGDWKYVLNKEFTEKYFELSKKLKNICKLLIKKRNFEAKILSQNTLLDYKNVPGRLGKYSLVEHLEKIVNLEGGWKIAAERAMTASIILGR